MEDFLKSIIADKKYLKLYSTPADEKMEKAIEELKSLYLGTQTKRRFGIDSESSDLLNHSEQSEILGKIVMLCHEYGGYRMVVETITQLHFKIDDMVIERMESMEKEIKELKK